MQRAPAGARSAENPSGEGPSTPAPAPAAGWFSQGLSMFSPTAPTPPPPPFLEARPAPWPKQDRTQAQTYYLREKEEEFLAKHGKLTKRQYKDKLKIRKEKWKLHWKHNMMPGDRKPHTDRFQAAKDDYEEKLKHGACPASKFYLEMHTY